MICSRFAAASPISGGHRAESSGVGQTDDVLATATELFVGRDRPSLGERTVFRELALNLLPQTSLAAKRRISCQLARCEATPQEVLEALAADPDPSTAYPILLHAENLPYETLLEQVCRGPESLRRTIAGRNDLDDNTLDTLLELGSDEALYILLNRTDVTFTSDRVETLLSRKDLPRSLNRLLQDRKILSDRQLMGHFLHFDRPERQQAIAAAELSALVDLSKSGSHRPARPVFKPKLLEILRQCALAPGPELFIAELSYALNLPLPFIQEMVLQDDGDALAIGLKALGVEPATAYGMLVRLLGQRLPLADIRRLQQLFDHVSHGAAMALVNRWIAVENPGKAPLAARVEPTVDDAARKPVQKPAQNLAQNKPGQKSADAIVRDVVQTVVQNGNALEARTETRRTPARHQPQTMAAGPVGGRPSGGRRLSHPQTVEELEIELQEIENLLRFG